MDFKVAGTKDFVTALQLDTKLDGIPSKVLAGALSQAHDARTTILAVMAEAIATPDEMSEFAPRITTIKVPVDKIGEVIGPKGKVINQITEETGANISIEDDGTVYVGAADGPSAQAAIDKINAIANPQLPKIGERFLGTVVKTTAFGAFVSLLPGRDGLVHISKLGNGKRIAKVEDVVNVGDKLRVEIADIDNRGKISLVPIGRRHRRGLRRRIRRGRAGRLSRYPPRPSHPNGCGAVVSFLRPTFPDSGHMPEAACFDGPVSTAQVELRGQAFNLVLATWVSTINFWAWNLIGPLSTSYAERMSLSARRRRCWSPPRSWWARSAASSSGPHRPLRRAHHVHRDLAGVDRCRCSRSVSPGCRTPMHLLLVFGFFLGIAGTIFAVGIPFANNWYVPERRGFATGVFGMGMVGTALSAFFTPRFVRWFGLMQTHIIIAVALALTAVLCIFTMRNSPAFTPNTDPVVPKLVAASKLRVTWEMSFLYAIVFGGFVAFSNYLPTYIKTIYHFDAIDAGTRTAAFALAAVIARPIGGTLSDRIPPKYVVIFSLAGTTVMAVIATFQPPADFWSAVTFISLAIFLGIGTGGVFGWVARRVAAAAGRQPSPASSPPQAGSVATSRRW